MTRTRQFVRGSVLSASGVGVSILAVFVATKLITTLLVPESLVSGFFLLLVASEFLVLVFGFGLPASLPKLVAAALPSEQEALINGSLKGVFAIGCAVALLLLVFSMGTMAWAPAIENTAWQTAAKHAWLLAPLTLLGLLRDTALAILAGLNAYGARAVALWLASLGQVVFVGGLLYVAGSSVVAVGVAYLLAYGAAVGWMLATLPELYRARMDWQAFRLGAGFSRPLYANSLLGFVMRRSDVLLVALLLANPAAAALYEVAKRIPLLVSRVLNALLVPLLPNLSALVGENDRARVERLLHSAYGITAFLAYSAALVLASAGEFVIGLIAPESYLAAASLLPLLLVASALALMSGIVGNAVIAAGQPVYVVIGNVFAAVFGVASAVLLVPRFGLSGGAYAAVAAQGCSFGAAVFFARRIGIPLRLFALAQPHLYLAMAGVVAWYGGFSTLARVEAIAVYGAACLLSGMVRHEHVDAAIRALAPRRMV